MWDKEGETPVNEWSYHDLLAAFGVGGAHPGGLALTRDVWAREKLTSKSRVLDIGCGTGQTSAFLAKQYGCRVTAIDRHPVMLQKAKRRFEKDGIDVQLVEGDAHQLPFADASFHYVIVESVTVFTDLHRSLPEYARVLRPGGVLLDLEMTAERPLNAKELAELGGVYGTKQVPTETEWCGRLQRAGFAKIDIVRGGTVASAITSTEQPDPDQFPEYDPSEQVDPKLYEIWMAHQQITERYSRRLGYRVYRAQRG